MSTAIDMQWVPGDTPKSIVKRMRAFVTRAEPRSKKITRDYAFQLKDQIVRNASGRPGPNKVTGDYVASWHVVEDDENKMFHVVTDAPEAMRLENGFVGVDSEGRHYDQPPFKHIAPAVDVIVPMWQNDLAREVGTWWK